ncbi:MAG: sulfur carrier protein ThiS [Sulfitobacter sp.]
MKLQLNGASVDARVNTLADLLVAEGFGEAKVATAVNGAFVPAQMRSDHILRAGDAIEILAPMQGG